MEDHHGPDSIRNGLALSRTFHWLFDRGIISIADTEKSYTEEMARIQRELFQAEENLAEHQTSLRELTSAAAKGVATNLAANVPTEQLARYKSVCTLLTVLERRQNDYLQQGFLDENKLVKENRDQMVAAAKTKVELELQYPSLAEMDSSVLNSATPAPVAEAVAAGQVASLPLRIKALQAQLSQIQSEAAKLNDAEAQIADLER